MHDNLAQLAGPWNDALSLYEMIPLLIVATLLCVAAAVFAYKLVSLFFRDGQHGRAHGPGGWRGVLFHLFFPDAAQDRQKLHDELQKLRALVTAGDHEKATLMEHQLRDQRRLADQQREIEVLQGQVNAGRAALDAETDKLQALSQHTKHLEKQLEEIMRELERIYHNASERSVAMPSSEGPPAPVDPIVTPPPADPQDPMAEKLKDIFTAYQKRVAERKARS